MLKLHNLRYRFSAKYRRKHIESIYRNFADGIMKGYMEEMREILLFDPKDIEITYPKMEGVYTLSPQPNIMNVLTPQVENLCFWYDGSLRPAKGHNGLCKWDFDGQIWRHL